MYRGNFDVVFQPIADLATRTVVAYEALSRFPSGSSPLMHFVDPAREGGDVELEITAAAKAVEAARDLPPGIPITVNASPLTVEGPALAQIFAEADRPVGIEISEHHRVTNYPRLRAQIEKLAPWRVLVDGGGSGHSTLEHIRLLKPNVIKLSAVLTARLDAAGADRSPITLFVAMANDLGSTVLANAVESEAAAARALECGITLGQGFLFGQPRPAR